MTVSSTRSTQPWSGRRDGRTPAPPFFANDLDEIIERKLPANGFPYAVRYRILDDRLLVMSVSHQHRHPDFGSDREP